MIIPVDIGVLFFTAAGIGAFIPVVGVILFARDTWRSTMPIFCALALIGSAVGVVGGMSRVGVVGNVVPAVLGLFGMVALYLFGIERSKGVTASIGAAALSISLVASYDITAELRERESDGPREIRTICSKAYTNPDLLANPIALQNFERKFGRYCKYAMTWYIRN